MKSKNAIKYLYGVNPFYVHWKRHFCPKCGNRVEIRYCSKIINSMSPEAENYDFSVGDTYLVGDVEFRVGYFYCPHCNANISFRDMKMFEKSQHKQE